jgi:hypothetical protein
VTRNFSIPPATATAFVLSGAFLGTIIGPPVMAVTAERAGYSTAWAVGAIALGTATLLVLVSRRLNRTGIR